MTDDNHALWDKLIPMTPLAYILEASWVGIVIYDLQINP